MNLVDNLKEANALYASNNYPTKVQFYKLLKRDNFEVSHKQVDEFIQKQFVHQITKRTNKLKRNMRKIVPRFDEPLQEFQIDLLQLDSYKSKNKGFQYILVMVDIWSRFAYCQPCINKTPSDVLKAIKLAIESNPRPNIQIIVHDDGGEYKGVFDSWTTKHDIASIVIESGNHLPLGIIDAFCKTMKNMIFRYFYAKNTTTWYDKLQSLVDIYNDRDHSFFGGHFSPRQALMAENKTTILEIHASNRLYNNLLSKKELHKSRKFVVGDHVRVLLKSNTFKRGYNANYSHDIFEITNIKGASAVLDDGSTHKISALLLALANDGDDDQPLDADVVLKAKIKKRVNRALKELA